MTPLPEFIEGLKILEPFLFHYGFKLGKMKIQQASGGQFTNATYTNGRKKLIIGYRYSVGLLDYQYDNSTVMHNFYLDGLGYADKRQYPDFQSDDKSKAFQHILNDFQYLKGDFFTGQCVQLIRIAEFQKKYYKELQERLHIEEEQKSNRLIIEKARGCFKEKNYKGCIEAYKALSKNYALTEFDIKTIALCKQRI